MNTLAQIEQEIHQLLETISESENQEEFEPLLAELLQNLDKKIDGYLYMIRYFEQQAEARQKESDRLQSLALESQSKAAYLKETLKAHMEYTQTKSLEGTYGKVSHCRNGGKAPIWFNPELTPDELPDDLTLTRKVIDHRKIRNLCEQNGGELVVDGVAIAKILERSSHLRIK